MEGEPGPEVFDERREKLKAICRPWLLRVRIRRDIVPLMKDIEELFNYTSTFIKAMEILPEDTQIYTEVEITKIKELYAETVEWKNTTAKAEAALKPYEDPVLKPDELKQKIVGLNREVQYLLNKAKTAKPKKPKTDKKKSEKKANDTTTIPPVDKTEIGRAHV